MHLLNAEQRFLAPSSGSPLGGRFDLVSVGMSAGGIDRFAALGAFDLVSVRQSARGINRIPRSKCSLNFYALRLIGASRNT